MSEKKSESAAAHVHGPGCSHGHQDHEGHDHGAHEEHEEKAHVHGAACDHGHDAHGHDHDGHDHHGHDHHGHDHGPKKERPPAYRDAEDGGKALQLELYAILPGESNEEGRFERFEELLRAQRGIRDAHIRRDLGHDELCIHYEADAIPAAELLQLARATGTKASKRYIAKTWFVRGMDSAQCAVVIEHSLDRMMGILEAHVAYASERVVVEFDSEMTSAAKIEARVEALGYTLETPEPGHVCSHHATGGGLAPKVEIPLSVAGGVLTVLGWASHFWASAPSWLAIACYGAAIASGGFFPARGAFQSLRQLRVDIESLMVLAALAAAVLGAWFEGAFLLFLFSLGHAIEHRAMDRARRAVEAISKLKPRTAQRMLSPVSTPDEVEEVPVEEVTKGDWIVVRPGDRVPMDGVILQGESSLEQAALTGESVPTPKGKGDEVYCGSINGDGALVVEVLRGADESVLAKMVDLVVQAEARQGPSQRFARKIEQRVVPLVLGGAILLPFGLLAVGLPLKEALLRTVALLVAASPCALAISTPAAVLSAVAAAARGGVLVKGGAYLEALANVDAIAFDKTGTLTAGKPRVVSIEPFDGATEDELLKTAAGLEVLSSHPLAKAIIDAAKQRGLEPLAADRCEAVQGKGLRAIVSGDQRAELGSLALFEGTEIPTGLRDTVAKLQKAGRTTVVVRCGDRFLGALGIADTLRPESKEVLRSLKDLGVLRLVMLSGDNSLVANAVGAEVGIDHVEAPLMPQGKVDVVRKMSRTRKGVAMVGDGVNDAPALASATVGVAMGGIGSDVALETADVVLMGDDLRRLPFAVALAQKTTSVIRQNLVISLGVAGVLVVASLLGIARVSESVIFHEGSTLLVVANGLRLLRFRKA